MRIGLILGAVFLAGCATVDRVTEDATKGSAKRAIDLVVAERLPGVNVKPVTDCIVNNATSGEILTIASSAVTGITGTTVSAIVEISRRPQTVACIATSGLGQISL